MNILLLFAVRFAEDFLKYFKEDLNNVYPAEDQTWLIDNLKEEVAMSIDSEAKEITPKSLAGV